MGDGVEQHLVARACAREPVSVECGAICFETWGNLASTSPFDTQCHTMNHTHDAVHPAPRPCFEVSTQKSTYNLKGMSEGTPGSELAGDAHIVLDYPLQILGQDNHVAEAF